MNYLNPEKYNNKKKKVNARVVNNLTTSSKIHSQYHLYPQLRTLHF